MSEKENRAYRPGFWCCFFWVLTWVGIFGGLVAIWLSPCICGIITLWGGAAVSAIISTVIRTVTKNRHDQTHGWHWFD